MARAIKDEIADQTAEVKIKSLRPAHSSTQVAIVELNPLAAKQLLRSKQFRVGWGLNRVRMRTQTRAPPRCFRCHERGNFAAQCKAEQDKSSQCFRCGTEGHRARDCTSGSNGIRNGQPGHGRSSTGGLARNNIPEEELNPAQS